MSEVKLFYMEGCPYCRNARRALDELKQENAAYAALPIDLIEENEHPDIADRYDYYHVPSMFIGAEKAYECAPGEGYDEIRSHIKDVLDRALAG